MFINYISFMSTNSQELTTITMNEDQWRTVIDAVNDKYPDSDCMEILINNVRHFPIFLNKE